MLLNKLMVQEILNSLQANHLDKLIKLKESFFQGSTRLQRLYTRRKMDSNGFFVPNYQGFGGKNNAD